MERSGWCTVLCWVVVDVSSGGDYASTTGVVVGGAGVEEWGVVVIRVGKNKRSVC